MSAGFLNDHSGPGKHLWMLGQNTQFWPSCAFTWDIIIVANHPGMSETLPEFGPMSWLCPRLVGMSQNPARITGCGTSINSVYYPTNFSLYISMFSWRGSCTITQNWVRSTKSRQGPEIFVCIFLFTTLSQVLLS